jgi:hypothetical protein
MTEIIEANFHIEFLTVLRVLFQGVLKDFDYRKIREALASSNEALAVSNQELAKTKAELETCQMSTRRMFAVGFFVLLLVILASRRG